MAYVLIRALVSWLVIAVTLAITVEVVDSVSIDGGMVATLWVAALFGLVNAVLGPVLRLLSLPLTLVTFGLFSLVVNGALLAITAGLTDYLDVGGFVSTIVAALLMSVLTVVTYFVLRLIVPDRSADQSTG